jgi:hypothetical protein
VGAVVYVWVEAVLVGLVSQSPVGLVGCCGWLAIAEDILRDGGYV